MNKKMLITLIVGMAVSAGLCYADTLLVPSQYPTIQEGISAAVNGDTVLVADGTYTGPGNKDLDFGGRAIVVTSENGPQNCIIDCEGTGVGFYFHSAEYHNSVVSGFTIINAYGGAIVCDGVESYPWDTSPTIRGNIIQSCNGLQGGGIYCKFSFAIISDNLITGNSADLYGGGIFCSSYMSPSLSHNTISSNTASSSGGGIYALFGANPGLVDCIVWGNLPQDISQYSASVGATYCDIGQDWPGVGNINQDPQFVNFSQNDYRLQWGSPCIDTGDPVSPLDPDGTVADMGAWYYDQSMPLRILLTPFDAPITIPLAGGSFDYAVQVTNIATSALNVDAWCDVTMPDGSVVGPVLGPVNFDLGSEVTMGRDRTQNVPGGAQAGIYSYNAYATAGTDTSTDNFAFVKLESDGSDWSSGWFNTGESFDELTSVLDDISVPKVYSLGQNYPNPFNPTTTLSFELRDASFVKMSVYDISGRLVTTLVDGWRDAGSHEVTFDGPVLASGVYFYRFTAGQHEAVGKIVLMK